MAELKSIKRWVDRKTREVRVYVSTVDGREGCKYITGNRFQAKGTVTGKLTKEDWKAAEAVAYWQDTDGKKRWHTWYPDDGRTDGPFPICPECGQRHGGTRCPDDVRLGSMPKPKEYTIDELNDIADRLDSTR